MMAGGAIHLNEVAPPEILDPRRIQGEPSGASEVPGMCHRRRKALSSTAIVLRGPELLRLPLRIVLRLGSQKPEQKQGCCGVAVLRPGRGERACPPRRDRQRLIAEEVGVSDFRSAGFEILGDLIVIFRESAEEILQADLPRPLGQPAEVLRLRAVVGSWLHTLETALA
jgi:hypothetical protein